jgi:hypothetical protein
MSGDAPMHPFILIRNLDFELGKTWRLARTPPYGDLYRWSAGDIRSLEMFLNMAPVDLA